MSYSAINTKMAVPSSRKRKTAITEDEPLQYTDSETEEDLSY